MKFQIAETSVCNQDGVCHFPIFIMLTLSLPCCKIGRNGLLSEGVGAHTWGPSSHSLCSQSECAFPLETQHWSQKLCPAVCDTGLSTQVRLPLHFDFPSQRWETLDWKEGKYFLQAHFSFGIYHSRSPVLTLKSSQTQPCWQSLLRENCQRGEFSDLAKPVCPHSENGEIKSLIRN